METDTFPNAGVQATMKGFICVFVDIDSDKEMKKKYMKEGIPSTSVFDKTGKLVDTFEGMMKPEEFIIRLRRSQAMAEGKEPPPEPESEGE